MLKLQEAPESIPQGEMPRHLTVYCERVLCERVAPGARVTVLGIYSIKKIAKAGVNYLFLYLSKLCKQPNFVQLHDVFLKNIANIKILLNMFLIKNLFNQKYLSKTINFFIIIFKNV